MPSGGLGDDEDTPAASGAVLRNVRRSATLAKSADLQTVLASQDDKDFGTKIFENIGLSDFIPAPVTHVGDLLKFRSYFMSQLGQRYVWMLKLPMCSEELAGPKVLSPQLGGQCNAPQRIHNWRVKHWHYAH